MLSGAEVMKVTVAIGILAVVTFTMFRGQGWWWRFSMRARVTFALFAVAFVVAAGYFYTHQ